MKKRRICLVAGLFTAAVFTAGSAIWASQHNGDDAEETVYKEVTVEKGTLTAGVTESGSVTIGTLSQEMEWESDTGSSSESSAQMGSSLSSSGTASSSSGNTSGLEVEEVYVSVGQAVEVGDPLIKLSAESVADYRQDLYDAVTEAKASVNEASLSAEKQKLSASYSYKLSTAEGSVAEETYQATLKELQDAVDEAQEAVDTSASLICYYQEQIAAGVDLSASLAEEQANYEKLSTRLTSAKNNYTTKSIEAEKTYQEALFSSQNASGQYNVDVAGADSTVKDAQETLSDASEALEEFDESVGEDGVICALYAGVITELGCKAGDALQTGTAIATFADADTVTITVSVSEEDITDIAVGDVVNIELTAYEDKVFDGTVENIDTSASSGSSTVSYNVTVAFVGDTQGIYTDMTGNVTFIRKQVQDVLYVSNKAVQTEGTTSYVKVKEEDGTIRRVNVVTGFSDGVNVEIVSGLTEGETVLIESQVKEE